jgi:hypothetical protein
MTALPGLDGAFLASPAGVAGFAAAVLWAPATGCPIWPAAARGRLAATLLISLAVGGLVFGLVRRALGGG